MTEIATPSSEATRLSIAGMRCAGCVESVETALRTVPGVISADVSFADHTAMVRGDVDPEKLKTALKDVGYDGAVMEGLEDTSDQQALEMARYQD